MNVRNRQPAAHGEPHDRAERLDHLLHRLRPDWHAQALCVLHPSVTFIGASNHTDYSAAKVICSECFVQGPCLDYALADASIVGCWGGTDDKERRSIRKAQQKRAA
jgi:WhiB family redox-sensing transcriptional regulator